MKKIFACLLMALSVVSLSAKTLYLYPNSDWKSVGARFAVYAYGNGEQWYNMTAVSGNTSYYQATVDDKYTYVIFCRMDGGKAENNWDNKWNQTGDMTVESGKDLCNITGWNSGEWSKYVAPDPEVKFYITGDWLGWNPKAVKSKADSYTLNLDAGIYALKITVDGEWETAKGFEQLTEKADGIYKSEEKEGDNNIGFVLKKAAEVTVTYTSSVFKLEGDFYVRPIDKSKMQLVPSEEWKTADAKFAAWIWGKELTAQWTDFFAPISAGNDTLQATIDPKADSIVFVRFSPKAKEPTWEHKEGSEVLVWGESKSLIDYTSMVWTIVGWEKGQWTPVKRVCESYGLLINGVYNAGKKNVLQTEWLEYKLLNVALKAGDKLQVRSDCANANWVISKYANTSYEFEIKDDKYVVAEDGSYDFYLKFIPDNDEIYISKAGFFTNSVPRECTDVMVQAFFNESYNDDAPGVSATKDYKLGLGNTRWTTLSAQADALAHSFDLIWLPPSAQGDGMGYHPKNYSDQNSNWGTAAELKELIDALHAKGSKVVADVVINHCQSTNGWLGFPKFDFGEYGTFQPDASYVCQNDEVNAEWNKDKAGSDWGKASGNYDDGENWEGARDWAHDMPKVQAMFKAYLQWLRNVVGYDGFRYDKGDGFNNWHHDNYNRTAGPYIAFMECYSGTDEIQGRIAGANGNLMALDFDTKWHIFDAFAGWDYNGKYDKPLGDGMLGRYDGTHAIEFIDSHDWFLRDDNENEFGGRGNSLTPELKDRLLQANAYLLSMPGVPCVFYPHWKKYQTEIDAMIAARKYAGVHSESAISDISADNDGFQATLKGKYGYLILQLANRTKHEDQAWDPAYKLMAKGNGYAMWVNRTAPDDDPTAIEQTAIQTKAQKFVENGQLFILRDGKVYTVTGQLAK